MCIPRGFAGSFPSATFHGRLVTCHVVCDTGIEGDLVDLSVGPPTMRLGANPSHGGLRL